MHNNFKKYKKGMGIKVQIYGDIDDYGNQKIRPGIIIRTYPSHIKVQLFSSKSNKNDYCSIIINNKTNYISNIL